MKQFVPQKTPVWQMGVEKNEAQDFPGIIHGGL